MRYDEIKGFLHGGDYNAEQWLDRPEILAEDIRLMKEAGVNAVTLGVFSWAMYEPRENEFHFEWLDNLMDFLMGEWYPCYPGHTQRRKTAMVN